MWALMSTNEQLMSTNGQWMSSYEHKWAINKLNWALMSTNEQLMSFNEHKWALKSSNELLKNYMSTIKLSRSIKSVNTRLSVSPQRRVPPQINGVWRFKFYLLCRRNKWTLNLHFYLLCLQNKWSLNGDALNGHLFFSFCRRNKWSLKVQILFTVVPK